MKRFFLCFFVLIFMVSLSSCQPDAVPSIGEENSVSSDLSLDAAMPMTLNIQTLRTKEEYQEYLQTYSVPPRFIGYEQIEKMELGEIIEIRLCHFYPNEYSYRLRDENGYEFHLRIEHLDDLTEELSNSTVLAFSGQTDLRKYPQKVMGTMSISNAEYSYFWGTLHAIKWYAGNVKFTLASSNRDNILLGEYPQSNNNTFIQKLLSTDTASASMSAFVQQVTDKSITE